MKRLVVSPLRWEYDLLVQSLKELGYESQKSKNITVFEDLNSIYAYGGHGKVDFALNTYHYLKEHSEIGEVLAVGACGALNQDLNPGDVVIGVQTIEHDYREKSRSRPKFSPHPHWLAEIKDKLTSHCFFGVIASGDEDIISRIQAFELHRRTGADVVAWEGAGGARACRLAQVPYMEIRGVTDRAGRGASKEFKNNLPHTMRNLAHTLVEIPPFPQ